MLSRLVGEMTLFHFELFTIPQAPVRLSDTFMKNGKWRKTMQPGNIFLF
jgi:hypothetical protein